MNNSFLQTVYENKKQKTKKQIYRITHPLEAVKENITYAKHLAFGNYDSYPASSQTVLNKYGNEIISSIVLHRNPLSKTITSLMSGWTAGETDRRISQQPKDQLFHIGMWVTLTNGKTIKIEKNASINLQENPTKPKEEQTSQNVPKPNNLTFGDMLEKTRKQVGNKKFFSYSSKNNNCGNFIEMILKANNLNTSATHEYIGQNTKEILDGFPKMRKLMNSITDLGGRIDTLTQENNNLPTKKYRPIDIPPKNIEEQLEAVDILEPIQNEVVGEGLKLKRTNKWIAHVKQIQKKNGISFKQALVEAKQTYKK